MIIKDFLVSLGLKDNMSEKLNESIHTAEEKVSKFASGTVKRFALAGTAVVAFTTTAVTGIAKFVKSLSDSDDELFQFQRTFGLTREEAYKTKSALDIMGKSMEEVQLNPRLLKQFNELKANASDLKIPDMSEGLKTVKEITTGVLSLKQTATNALQWVGHNLLKYIKKPLEDIKTHLNGFNATIKKNIPEWSDKVGKALSWIVQLGGTIIRVGGRMLGAVKKVFEAIPGGVKIAMAALGALAAFIKMGPIGRLITIISAALLLLDDFFTYLDGGESLLGGVWEKLTDFFSGFTDSGKDALAFFSEDFLPKLVKSVSEVFPKLVEKVLSYVDPFVEWIVNILDSVITAIGAALPELLKLGGNIVISLLEGLLSKVPVIIKAATTLIKSLISAIKGAVPKIIEIAGDIVSTLIDVIIDSLPDILDAAVELVMALVDGILDALPDIIDAVFILIEKLLTALIENLPRLVEIGIEIVNKLIFGILNALPSLIQSIIKLLNQLIKTLIDSLPEILNAGIEIIMSLIDGLISMLPELIEIGISLIFSLIEGITENLPQIMQAGVQVVLQLIMGIIKAVPKIIKAVIELIPKIVTALIKALPQILKAGVEIILALTQGIIDSIPQLIAAIPEIIAALVEGFSTMYGDFDGVISGFIDMFKAAFGAIFENAKTVWNGLLDFFRQIWGHITNVFSGVTDFFKKIFGGASDGIKNAFKDIKDFFKNIFEAIVGVVKAPINAIIQGINSFIKSLNELKIPDWVPGVGGKSLNLPTIPELEKGGVLEKGQTGYLEGNGAEAVVPLEKNTGWINKVAEQFKGAFGGDTSSPEGGKPSSKIESLVSTISTILSKIYEAIIKFKEKAKDKSKPESDGDPKASGRGGNGNSGFGDKFMKFIANAGKISQSMTQVSQSSVTHNAVSNSNVNYRTTNIDNRQNYTINDTSGNPRTTAQMVGNTQELQVRNLKGVFA